MSKLTEQEKLEKLYGKAKPGARAALRKMNTLFGLEMIDENTGEYSNTLDIEKIFNDKENSMKARQPKAQTPQTDSQTNTGTSTPKKEKVRMEGILAFKPGENTPEWVLAEVVINPDTFYDWLHANQKYLHKNEKYGEQLKLTVKRSQDGKPYVELNTYGLPE